MCFLIKKPEQLLAPPALPGTAANARLISLLLTAAGASGVPAVQPPAELQERKPVLAPIRLRQTGEPIASVLLPNLAAQLRAALRLQLSGPMRRPCHMAVQLSFVGPVPTRLLPPAQTSAQAMLCPAVHQPEI
mgnify:CR=1 FL=1